MSRCKVEFHSHRVLRDLLGHLVLRVRRDLLAHRVLRVHKEGKREEVADTLDTYPREY